MIDMVSMYEKWSGEIFCEKAAASERILAHFESFQALCCINKGLVHKSNRKFTAY